MERTIIIRDTLLIPFSEKMSVQNPDRAMTCPVCLDTMCKPIMQCERGHSMCGSCIVDNQIKICPYCRGDLSKPIRNHQLEDLIEGLNTVLKISCAYSKKGCKYVLSSKEKNSHELECRYRTFQCEGKKFVKWKCDWSGNLGDMYQHFKNAHNNHTWMEYRTEANIKICFTNDFCDLQIINFHNGQNYFYYKHKVDVAKSKVYWIVQFVGMKSHAQHYYYEFEIYKGPIQKLKYSDICVNDTENVDKLFETEKCVVMSFPTVKNFLNDEGELPFKFRIMSIKKTIG